MAVASPASSAPPGGGSNPRLAAAAGTGSGRPRRPAGSRGDGAAVTGTAGDDAAGSTAGGAAAGDVRSTGVGSGWWGCGVGAPRPATAGRGLRGRRGRGGRASSGVRLVGVTGPARTAAAAPKARRWCPAARPGPAWPGIEAAPGTVRVVGTAEIAGWSTARTINPAAAPECPCRSDPTADATRVRRSTGPDKNMAPLPRCWGPGHAVGHAVGLLIVGRPAGPAGTHRPSRSLVKPASAPQASRSCFPLPLRKRRARGPARDR
jgi:hypothetical protein